ncbi:MAG TPA: TIGR02266 family protein [Polyangia bacterium]|nr:TIGR02266 family protein [Polyangia bacterium]
MEQPTSNKEARAPINLRIKFRSESIDQFIERYSIDVSRGGIFIRTREPLAVGTQLKFDFQLQDAAPLMAGEGTVVWIREYDPNRAGVTPGMGVRFDKLTPTSQPVLDRILQEKGRRDQSAVSPGTTSKVGAGMAVRRPSSTFTALDPAVTGSGPVSASTGLPAARAAAILEKTNLGYQAPSVPGAPPQMTLPSSPAKAMTPSGLATLESQAGRAGATAGAGLVSRLTPTNAHKYEPPSSADIDKALDGLVPGGDVTAGVSASGAGPAKAAADADSAAPSGIVDPMSEPTQIADRLPDFHTAPTRIGGIDRSAEPKPSLDARLSALGAAVADTPAPPAAAAKDAKDGKDGKDGKDVRHLDDGQDAKHLDDGKDKTAASNDKVAALDAVPATAKGESKPAAARKAPAASKRPTALIIGGVLVAAVVVVVAATKLTSSDREQEGLREHVAAQPAAAPAPPPAPEPVPSPPTPAPAPVAAAEPVPAPAAAPAPSPAAAPEPAAASAGSGETNTTSTKTKDEPSAAKPAKTSTPRKTATATAKKPAAAPPAEATTATPLAAKTGDDSAAQPTPEAQIPQSLLKISSSPSGAEVLIDGKSVGKTPYQGKQIDFSQPHAVTLKLDGYEPYEHMVGASDWTKAKNLQTAKVTVKLHKAGGATAAKSEGSKTEPGKAEIGPPAVEILTPEPIKPESSEPRKIESPPGQTP